MTIVTKEHYLCENCGHEIASTEPGFKCVCLKCLEWLKVLSIR